MDRMHTLTPQELDHIHNATLELLGTTGICFNSQTATDLFKARGFNTQGNTVFFTPDQVQAALDTVPDHFTIQARNPEKNVALGGNDFITLATGGATNVADLDGNHRPTTMADYLTCCKLVQTSTQLDTGGYLMVQPGDMPQDTAYLDMVYQYIKHCDKPIFGASENGQAARDSVLMAAMALGVEEADIPNSPILITNINAMSPLQFSEEQTDVIMEMARWRQPVVITNMILAGSTGPISLAGLLALENTEILAGIILAQTVSPGTPVVYGSTSAPMDMKTTVGAVGAPETARIAAATTQMAEHYSIPCRAGGALTDAHLPDGQAMAESALLISTAIRNGAHFLFHSCGQMGSYISMGFEKWLMDEEVLAQVRNMLTPLEITPESLDTALIKEVGIGGQYLTHPNTFSQFKTLSQPMLANRQNHEKWTAAGGVSMAQAASKALEQRLADYREPRLDPAVDQRLTDYLNQRKQAHEPC